jgi:hypothetical protein
VTTEAQIVTYDDGVYTAHVVQHSDPPVTAAVPLIGWGQVAVSDECEPSDTLRIVNLQPCHLQNYSPHPFRYDSCINPLGKFLCEPQTGHKRGLMGTHMNGNLITAKYQTQKQLYFAKLVPRISIIYRSANVHEVTDGRISSRITIDEHIGVHAETNYIFKWKFGSFLVPSHFDCNLHLVQVSKNMSGFEVETNHLLPLARAAEHPNHDHGFPEWRLYGTTLGHVHDCM